MEEVVKDVQSICLVVVNVKLIQLQIHLYVQNVIMEIIYLEVNATVVLIFKIVDYVLVPTPVQDVDISMVCIMESATVEVVVVLETVFTAITATVNNVEQDLP